MIIRFDGGIPKECIDWLRENVGEGNVSLVATKNTYIPASPSRSHAWKFERKTIQDEINPNKAWHVPTIEVFDDEKAAWFALRWS